MIDFNEIVGFLGHVNNADVLHNLYLTLGERLQRLGRSVALTPVPPPTLQNNPPPWSRPEPEKTPKIDNPNQKVLEAFRAMVDEECLKAKPSAKQEARPEAKQEDRGASVSIGGAAYEVRPIEVAGKLVGYRVGDYETLVDGGSCSCDDYKFRHAKQGGRCKHGDAVVKISLQYGLKEISEPQLVPEGDPVKEAVLSGCPVPTGPGEL